MVWKRLANSAVQFNTEHAQALVWRDYVVFVQNDCPKCLHLYHLKHGLWSQITVSFQTCEWPDPQLTDASTIIPDHDPIYTPADGQAFAVYDGHLIFLAKSGKIWKFVANKWHEYPKAKLHVAAQSYKFMYTIFTTALLTDHNMRKFESLVLLEAEPRDGHSLHNFRYCLNISSYWTGPSKLQKSIRVSGTNHTYHVSFATSQGYFFVSNGFQVYSIKFNMALSQYSYHGQLIPVTEIAQLPPPMQCMHMYTIATVKDTVFAFGGKDVDNQPSSDVHRYNLASKTWEPVGYMRSARYGIIVTSAIQNDGSLTDIIAIGGYFGSVGNVNLLSHITESCTV